jgi:hypothetical protein
MTPASLLLLLLRPSDVLCCVVACLVSAETRSTSSRRKPRKLPVRPTRRRPAKKPKKYFCFWNSLRQSSSLRINTYSRTPTVRVQLALALAAADRNSECCVVIAGKEVQIT